MYPAALTAAHEKDGERCRSQKQSSFLHKAPPGLFSTVYHVCRDLILIFLYFFLNYAMEWSTSFSIQTPFFTRM